MANLSQIALSTAHFRTSDKFPTLCTVTVDGTRPSISGIPPQTVDQNEWKLPYFDVRHGSTSLLRLHTLDIYFWTLADANFFLSNVRALLAPNQLDLIANAAPAAHEAMVSPVVQQLENIAISDPTYHNGQARDSRRDSNIPQAQTSTQSFPTFMGPPPNNSTTPVSPLTGSPAPPIPRVQEQQVDFKPLAYNPAAPAPPEPIKHREKTPPPPDAETGTGLATAAAVDHHQYISTEPDTLPAGFVSSQPPPVSAQVYGGSGIRSASYSPPTVSTGPGTNPSTLTNLTNYQSGGLSFAPPPPPQPSTSVSLGTVSTVAPYSSDTHARYYTPATNPQSSTHQQYPPQYADYAQIPPPSGGYFTHSYNPPQQAPAAGSEYDIHRQVYRPTEAENAHAYNKQKQNEAKSGLEKGVGKFWKKLERKL